jgi:ferredoxin-NADP reductase
MLPYVDELRHAGATVAFTRHEDGQRPAGAPTREELLPLLTPGQLVYVCGSPRFAEYAVPLVLDCGVDPTAVRVEQFGATG